MSDKATVFMEEIAIKMMELSNFSRMVRARVVYRFVMERLDEVRREGRTQFLDWNGEPWGEETISEMARMNDPENIPW